MKKTRIPRDSSDLRDALKEQIGLLQMAADAYDAGTKDAAKYLAVTLRSLFHQTRTSDALLEQLGIRTIRFSEWAYAGKRNRSDMPPGDWSFELDAMVGEGKAAKPVHMVAPLISVCRLAVTFHNREKAEYVAPLSATGREIRKRFRHWWNDEVIQDVKGRVLSRRDIVLNMADTDGGAHVDPALEERYLEFSRKNSLSWNFKTNDSGWQAIPSPHLPCVRQITHEVLVTLGRVVPELFVKPYAFSDPLRGREGFSIGSVMLEIQRVDR